MWKFSELSYFLASLYYRQEDILDVIKKSGHKDYLPFLPISSRATVFWSSIISYAEERNTVADILNAVLADGHDQNEYLKSLLQNPDSTFKSPYSNTRLDENPVIKASSLEKLTSGKSTLLPISFLQKGIETSKSVVRVVSPSSLGTGFLLRNKYFITNNHVIDSKELAALTRVQLNYEVNEKGALYPFETFELDPFSENGFATSVKHDWTVVKLKNFSDEAQNKYGFLKLMDQLVAAEDFVNIIQHPGGETKQIALYHNLVVSSNSERIQYLTDTQPGSSGSPVFNSKWEVVALHHAGGELAVINTNKKQLVNEGININLVRDQIKENNILV